MPLSENLCLVQQRDQKNGGARRDRTDDLLRAKQALSQLSYGPIKTCSALVGLGGFEPPTSPLSGVRSNQLSYRPILGYYCSWLSLQENKYQFN